MSKITAEQSEFLRARLKDIRAVSVGCTADLSCNDCILEEVCVIGIKMKEHIQQLLAEYEAQEKEMNNKQQIADVARRIIEQNGVCGGISCIFCPCGSSVTGDTCRMTGNANEESDEAVKICQQWLIDNGYDLQQKEATMNEQKEIKFQDRTRGGHEYRIYTREGMSDEFPLVGEALGECGWDVQCWTKDGRYYNRDDESDFDLIPVESAELEGLTVGDYVYAIDAKLEIYTAKITGTSVCGTFWVETGFQRILIDTHGFLTTFGNGQKIFYRSKERALESIEEK